MMADTQERPGVEERYETATHTSSMLVEAHRQNSADVIIAAGWSESRVGMALLRLHSEWDSAAKPKRATEPMIQAIAERLKGDEQRARATAERNNRQYTPQGSPISRARAEAIAWYARELRLLAQGLKSRAPVLEQLTAWTILKGMDSQCVGPALFHWLAPTCPVCDGHGLRKVPDQPALSAKRCHHCSGSGKSPRPEGAARIQNHLDRCVDQARQSLKHRLRPGG
jgi:hypothetical protein